MFSQSFVLDGTNLILDVTATLGAGEGSLIQVIAYTPEVIGEGSFVLLRRPPPTPWVVPPSPDWHLVGSPEAEPEPDAEHGEGAPQSGPSAGSPPPQNGERGGRRSGYVQGRCAARAVAASQPTPSPVADALRAISLNAANLDSALLTLASRSRVPIDRLRRAAHVAEQDSVVAASAASGIRAYQEGTLLRFGTAPNEQEWDSVAWIVLYAPARGVEHVRWTTEQLVYRRLVCPADQQPTQRGRITFDLQSVSRAVASFAEVEAYHLGLGFEVGRIPHSDNTSA